MDSALLVNEFALIKYPGEGKTSEALDLPKDKVIGQVILDVAFRFALATGGGADPAYVEDGVYKFIDDVEISLGGAAYRRLSANAQRFRHYLMNGVDPITVKPAISGTGNYDVKWQLPFDCGAFGVGQLLPEKSYLRTETRKPPTIRTRIGTVDQVDVLTGGSRVVTVSNVEIQVMIAEPKVPHDPALLRTIIEDEITWSGATDKLKFPLNLTENDEIRGVLLIAIKAGVRDDTVCNRVDLLAGVRDNVCGATWDRLGRENANDFGFAMPTGIRYLNFDRSKRWKDMLPVRGLSDLRLLFDVDAPSGVTSIVIVVDRVQKF